MIVWLVLLASMVACHPSLNAFLWFKNYKKQDPQEVISMLQKKQIDRPNDPHLNYNLGVALYKAGDRKSAHENFNRALQHNKDDIPLRKRCMFNLGNICVQSGLDILGDDWDQKDIADKTLDEAIQKILPGGECR